MTRSTRFQNGSLSRVKNSTTADTWFFRFYEDVGGKNVYRNRKIGTVREYPHRRDAERAVQGLRAKINTGIRSPETVNDLIAHYRKHELTEERKAFSTVEVYSSFLKLYVAPRWGDTAISEVRSVVVEQWLTMVPLSPATRAKIKQVFSALFAHAVRHEWTHHNPIIAVRCSGRRLREKDVLTPAEVTSVLTHLSVRDRAMVLLAATTGLRRSEFIGLRWSDIVQRSGGRIEISVNKSCVRNHFGETKTDASRRPVSLDMRVFEVLLRWRTISHYGENEDFIFASDRLRGQKPLCPSMVLKKALRPALTLAGVEGKVIGWHSFRHTLATNLRNEGVDLKVAQDMLRHANSRTTMDIYTHSVAEKRHEATGKMTDLILPLHCLAPSGSQISGA